MQAFKKFILWEMVLTISIGIIALFLFQTICKIYYLPVFWILLGVISLLTGVLHYTNIQVSEKNTSKFTSGFLTVTGIKMMIYLILITLYVLLKPQNATVFLISFLILYFLYTAFEVVQIVLFLKTDKNHK